MRWDNIRTRPLIPLLLLLIAVLSAALLWTWVRQRSSGASIPAASITPAPGTGATQQITIESPQADQQLGSPFALRGRTARLPFENILIYRVFDASGSLIGTAPFQAQGTAGQPGTFETQAEYQGAGGAGRVEVVEFNAADGSLRAIASTRVQLQAAGPPLPPPPPQAIAIDTPLPGTTVGSPVVLTGRVARLPFEGRLAYRVLNTGGVLLGGGFFGVASDVVADGTSVVGFNGSLSFNLPLDGGPVRVEVLDINPADQAVAAQTTIDLQVAPQQQAIAIESPAAGTTVGSPVVITGRSSRAPDAGVLNYRFFDANNIQLGAGTVPVSGAAGQQGTFNASLNFTLPTGGGPVRLELSDGSVATSLVLSVAPPAPAATPPPTQQSIVIDTPPPGTTVGSPVVITGRTARFPTSGVLSYRFLDAANAQLGGGTFAVSGAPGQPGSFNAQLDFTLPPPGGPIRVEVTEANQANGSTLASAALTLSVAPPAPPVPPTSPPQPTSPPPAGQQVFIDTPAAGTQVGSPVVVTGRIAQVPALSDLAYRVTDASGAVIGEGRITAQGAPGQPGSFNAQLTFSEPPGGGTISVEIFDAVESGEQVGRATLPLVVAPPAPPTAVPPPTAGPQPPVPPTGEPQIQPPVSPTDEPAQQISIDAPAAESVVTTTLQLYGTLARPPADSSLGYRVTDADGNELGSGTFVVPTPRSRPINFVTSLKFTAPAAPGLITVEVFENATAGASASVTLRYGPQPRS